MLCECFLGGKARDEEVDCDHIAGSVSEQATEKVRRNYDAWKQSRLTHETRKPRQGKGKKRVSYEAWGTGQNLKANKKKNTVQRTYGKTRTSLHRVTNSKQKHTPNAHHTKRTSSSGEQTRATHTIIKRQRNPYEADSPSTRTLHSLSQ